MGHGIASTLLTGLAVGAYRHARRDGATSRRCTRRSTGRSPTTTTTMSFATGIIGRLATGTGRLEWSCAGHPPPLLLRGRKVVAELAQLRRRCRSVSAAAAPELCATDLEPGDAVLLYTDGVTEATRPTASLFGLDRLTDLLEREAASGHAAGGDAAAPRPGGARLPGRRPARRRHPAAGAMDRLCAVAHGGRDNAARACCLLLASGISRAKPGSCALPALSSQRREMPVSEVAQARAPLAAHAALLYASMDEFLTWALRFVDAGLDEDEPVLVSAPRPEISFLRARMSERAHRVTWADITRIGANPGRIIPHVHTFASAHAGRPVRYLQKLAWPGRTRAEQERRSGTRP